MKKTLLLTIAILPLINGAFGQEIWTQITGTGFGYPNQNTVPEMEVFDGKIYASTSPTGMGLAKLWHSSTGNVGTWTDSAFFSPPLVGDQSIHSFGKATIDSIDYFWLGTGSIKGTAIYRSLDGINWIQISKRGFGNPLLVGATPHMMVFQGTADSIPYLYAGGISHGAGTPAQVWRTPYHNTDSSSNWTLLMDFASIDTNIQTVSYFEVWNDTLYFGTDAGGFLYETVDGINFTMNQSLSNSGGYGANKVIASIEVFNNDLYISTNNPLQGGHLWLSSDGYNWTQITGNAFGKNDTILEMRSLRTSFGKIWVTGYTDIGVSKGTPVWRSDDGINWTQSNIDGFGNPQNNGENAVTLGFGNYQYFGGPNYNSGGQVWRADMTTGTVENEQTQTRVDIFPNPFSVRTTLQIDNPLKNAILSVYNCFGQKVAQTDNISGETVVLSRNNLANGLYFVNIKMGNQLITKKKLIITD